MTTSTTKPGEPGFPGASGLGGRGRFAALFTLVLSLLACYGTLAALAALSALGVTLALDPGIWAGVIVLFAVLAAAAVALGARRHGSMLPVLPALAGVALLGYVMFGRFDRVLELVAFALLGAAVLWDYRLRAPSERAGTLLRTTQSRTPPRRP
jgi:hypothetical protein